MFDSTWTDMKRLLIAAFGCGACLLQGPLMAATSGTISVTGNIGGDCSVEGANLTFQHVTSADALIATGQATWSSTSANTIFSLTPPQISTPPTEQQGIVYGATVNVDFVPAFSPINEPQGSFMGTFFEGPSASVTPGAPFNGAVGIQATITEATDTNILPAGDYSLTATATCVIP